MRTVPRVGVYDNCARSRCLRGLCQEQVSTTIVPGVGLYEDCAKSRCL